MQTAPQSTPTSHNHKPESEDGTDFHDRGQTYTKCLQASLQDSKSRLALAIKHHLDTLIEELNELLKLEEAKKKKEQNQAEIERLSADIESLDTARINIVDGCHVDPKDPKAMQDAIGNQSLLSIYQVYEKLKGKSTASTEGASSASEGRPSTPSMPEATAAGPNREAEAFKEQGNIAMRKLDSKAAIDFYTKAINLVPTNPIYLSNRAAAYLKEGLHAQASTDAELAVASDPKYIKGWSRLGNARSSLGDLKGSMEAYGKGVEFSDSTTEATTLKAVKDGYELTKQKLEEEAQDGDESTEEAARGGTSGPGGMPDLSSLAGMFGGGRGGGGGGGGGPDLGSIMNNPMFASMAQNIMSNPDMMNNLMSNPRLREMAQNFGSGGGMPDVSALMQDPSLAEMYVFFNP